MVPRFVKPLVQSARLLVVIAVALVCLLLLLQFPAFSQDSIAVPAAPGSLSGRVTNAAGDPLAGIEVRLCYLSSCSRTALTGPDGRYEFLGLPPATYLVEFRDPSRVYAPQFYGNVVDQALATGVVVSGNAVIDIDAVLAPGATVTGSISGVPAIGQSWYYVYLFRRSASLTWLYEGEYGSQGITASLPYTFTGLAAGAYVLCGISAGEVGYFSECYEDLLARDFYQPPADAVGFPLAAGETRRVDMVIGNVSQLSGRVFATDGNPLAGVTILATDQTLGNGGWARTGADGSYRFAYLWPGSYTVRFEDPSGRYLVEYYQDAALQSDARPVPVTDASRSVIDATLTAAARVTGTVTLEDGSHPPLISLMLWQPAAGGAWEPAYTTWNWEMAIPGDEISCRFACYDPATGRFSKGIVAAGRYRLSVRYEVNWQAAIESFYGGVTVDDAADIVLAEGETRSGLDITLGVGEFEGVITGRVRAGETALPGIEVALFDSSFPLRPLVSTATDAEGRYRFEGLIAGSYRVGFRDPAGRYAPSFYRNQPSLYAASTLTLTKGMEVDDVNARLTVGGSIRGQVRRNDGAPVQGYWVVVYLTNAAGDQAEQQIYLEARTDANGNYQLPGLNPGRYYVTVWLPNYPDGSPVAAYPTGAIGAGAQAVTVEAGKVVEGIDIVVGVTPVLYLPFVERE